MRRWLKAADLYEAAGHTTVPISIEEIRAMATKSIGKISKKALAEGKVKPSKSTPPHFAAAKKAKADRTEKALRGNRAKVTAKVPAKKPAAKKARKAA